MVLDLWLDELMLVDGVAMILGILLDNFLDLKVLLIVALDADWVALHGLVDHAQVQSFGDVVVVPAIEH